MYRKGRGREEEVDSTVISMWVLLPDHVVMIVEVVVAVVVVVVLNTLVDLGSYHSLIDGQLSVTMIFWLFLSRAA